VNLTDLSECLTAANDLRTYLFDKQSFSQWCEKYMDTFARIYCDGQETWESVMTSTLRRWILGISTAFDLAVGSGSANAVTIEHNGFATTEIPGSGGIDVAVTNLFGLCETLGGSFVDLCFEKFWLSGTEDQVHTMTLSEVGDEPFTFLEFVLNVTGVP
jgi:hypothetical protein